MCGSRCSFCRQNNPPMLTLTFRSFKLKLSTAKLYKMFGLDAYKEKYGEYIHDVDTSLLEWQYQNVGEFVLSNPSMVAESNYIILVEIKNELWIRNVFKNYGEDQ
jgi:hypothetical protein